MNVPIDNGAVGHAHASATTKKLEGWLHERYTISFTLRLPGMGFVEIYTAVVREPCGSASTKRCIEFVNSATQICYDKFHSTRMDIRSRAGRAIHRGLAYLNSRRTRSGERWRRLVTWRYKG